VAGCFLAIALPDATNNEVMKVKAAKYFSKFDYRHGRA
jgi:hypothetical protein